MSARAALALGVSLILFLAGCGTRTADRKPEAAAPAPSVSTPPEPTPTPTPTPKPTRAAPPRLRPAPTTLPAGLRRTTGTRAVALTFDDGPHPVWTPKLLAELRAAGAKATFCVVGTQVRKHPELVARIAREGHQLCNHSWRHDVDLGRRPAAQIRADLARTNQAIRDAVPGAKVPYYRQPGGRWTPQVVAAAKQLGMRSLHWTVDPQDWAKPTAKTITRRVTGAVRPGAVVLMHDGGGNRAATIAACGRLIGDLKRRYGLTRLG
ncbi:polysaccharide deacetylase family protein [Micromonospora okii]|uniref:polysaccharide deacetylase family protein n=1 Tax=Micromonospora okii TaxID=1182970 RepID=UPI001E49D40A|nr:polysaccharide deacetylase family protein [Micromonospora okii]